MQTDLVLLCCFAISASMAFWACASVVELRRIQHDFAAGSAEAFQQVVNAIDSCLNVQSAMTTAIRELQDRVSALENAPQADDLTEICREIIKGGRVN